MSWRCGTTTSFGVEPVVPDRSDHADYFTPRVIAGKFDSLAKHAYESLSWELFLGENSINEERIRFVRAKIPASQKRNLQSAMVVIANRQDVGFGP